VDQTLSYGAAQTLPPGRDGLIFPIGEKVNGTFEIRQLLGSGGMGQVLEAHDLALNRLVAIKAAWPDERMPPLRNEAQALAAVRHPSLPTVHALGMWRNVEYLVMERVFGLNLREHLNRRYRDGECFSVAEVITILTSLAEALRAVHEAGVIHRDIKPANVMLAPPARVVLMDFGVFAPGYDSQRGLGGTPEYMAPEALEGRVQAGAGHLLDLYALGVLAFEMVTGARPRPDVRQNDAPVRALREDVPAWLARLVAQLMDADPDARPQSADEVVWRLRGPGERRPLRVLVVDDDPDTGEVLRLGIHHACAEAEVRVARNGQEALAMLQHLVPDIMTVDLEMPAVNGLELCLSVLGTPSLGRCHLVVVTGKGQGADLRVLGQLGIRQVVRKTPGFVSRVAAVAAELNGRRR
jgi:eukaryotic-like serine/threonine-protein kinase